jgi:hypothetical protein
MKTLFWIGSSKKDLKAMPTDVQDTFGYALHLAQLGKKHGQTKLLKGFGSAGVLEVVEVRMAARFGLFIPLNSLMRFMCSIASRKNQRTALQHPNRIWMLSGND